MVGYSIAKPCTLLEGVKKPWKPWKSFHSTTNSRKVGTMCWGNWEEMTFDWLTGQTVPSLHYPAWLVPPLVLLPFLSVIIGNSPPSGIVLFNHRHSFATALITYQKKYRNSNLYSCTCFSLHKESKLSSSLPAQFITSYLHRIETSALIYSLIWTVPVVCTSLQVSRLIILT